jgi:hypothetical protein
MAINWLQIGKHSQDVLDRINTGLPWVLDPNRLSHDPNQMRAYMFGASPTTPRSDALKPVGDSYASQPLSLPNVGGGVGGAPPPMQASGGSAMPAATPPQQKSMFASEGIPQPSGTAPAGGQPSGNDNQAFFDAIYGKGIKPRPNDSIEFRNDNGGILPTWAGDLASDPATGPQRGIYYADQSRGSIPMNVGDKGGPGAMGSEQYNFIGQVARDPNKTIDNALTRGDPRFNIYGDTAPKNPFSDPGLLRQLITQMFPQFQTAQVPDSTPTAPSGGLLPNNQGMAPGGLPADPMMAANADSMFRV